MEQVGYIKIFFLRDVLSVAWSILSTKVEQVVWSCTAMGVVKIVKIAQTMPRKQQDSINILAKRY